MQLSEVLSGIDEAAADHSIPRRLRELLAKISEDLKKEGQDPAVKLTSAVYELEAAANDVNIPMHIKTVLWDLISSLEAVKRE